MGAKAYSVAATVSLRPVAVVAVAVAGVVLEDVVLAGAGVAGAGVVLTGAGDFAIDVLPQPASRGRAAAAATTTPARRSLWRTAEGAGGIGTFLR
jgi:hypothetical protein